MGLENPTMWHVYQYMVSVYTRSGHVAKLGELENEFPNADMEAIVDGAMHFHEIIQGCP